MNCDICSFNWQHYISADTNKTIQHQKELRFCFMHKKAQKSCVFSEIKGHTIYDLKYQLLKNKRPTTYKLKRVV